MRGAVRRPNRGLRLHGSGKAGCVQLGYGEVSLDGYGELSWSGERWGAVRFGGYGALWFVMGGMVRNGTVGSGMARRSRRGTASFGTVRFGETRRFRCVPI